MMRSQRAKLCTRITSLKLAAPWRTILRRDLWTCHQILTVNEAQSARVKDEAQRGGLCAATLMYLSTGGRWPSDVEC